MQNSVDLVTSIWSVHGTTTNPQVYLYIPMGGGIVWGSVSRLGLTPGCTLSFHLKDQHGEALGMSPVDARHLYQACQEIKYVLSQTLMIQLDEIRVFDGMQRIVG